MSDNSEPTSPEAPGWGASATATLPPADLQWELPPAPGASGGGGGWPNYPNYPSYPPYPPAPPARRPSRNGMAVLAAVVLGIFSFFVASHLRDNGSTSPLNFGGQTNPFGGNSSTQASPTGTSSLSTSQINSIATTVDQSVVDIDTVLGLEDGEAAGTGMILSANGEILTNNHVIDGATKITVTVVSTGKSYTAHVVGTDPTADVAVIQMDGASGLKPITAAKAGSVSIGDAVVALGNAGGRGGTPSVATGSVVATGQTITAADDNGGNAQRLSDLIETDAPIQPGDSGGPLINSSGQIIGMDSAADVSGARFRNTTTFGYAIPIQNALSIADQIESGKASSTIHLGLPGFLGVEVAGDGSTAGGRLGGRGVTSTNGALITGVSSGTPAASIGLTGGDTITAINGQTVGSSTDLTSILQGTHAGDKVTVDWTDSSGGTHSAKATLAEGPAD